jgi:hypothetical protein
MQLIEFAMCKIELVGGRAFGQMFEQGFHWHDVIGVVRTSGCHLVFNYYYYLHLLETELISVFWR